MYIQVHYSLYENSGSQLYQNCSDFQKLKWFLYYVACYQCVHLQKMYK